MRLSTRATAALCLGRLAPAVVVAALVACGREGSRASSAGSAEEARAAAPADTPPSEPAPPAGGSPRHGEYVMLATAQGDSVRAWLVYPERPDPAPGVIVIHEIFGLSDWIRSVADRYAGDGFVAIAPDLLWGRAPGGGGTDAYPDQDAVIAAVRELPQDVVKARLDAARAYLQSLPAATDEVGSVGFCWGGRQSFQYAAEQPELDAAVVFYGSPPEPLSSVSGIQAPVLGLYGGDDARVNASIPDVESAMTGAGKSYEKEIYPGAGHGFLRQAEAGPNADAAARAWPRSVEFLREHLAGAGG